MYANLNYYLAQSQSRVTGKMAFFKLQYTVHNLLRFRNNFSLFLIILHGKNIGKNRKSCGA